MIPSVLMLAKMSRHLNFKTFKVKDKNNRLISFHINDDKVLKKYKTIWTKSEELKNIELNALPV